MRFLAALSRIEWHHSETVLFENAPVRDRCQLSLPFFSDQKKFQIASDIGLLNLYRYTNARGNSKSVHKLQFHIKKKAYNIKKQRDGGISFQNFNHPALMEPVCPLKVRRGEEKRRQEKHAHRKLMVGSYHLPRH